MSYGENILLFERKHKHIFGKVSQFTYLGCKVIIDNNMPSKITVRITKSKGFSDIT